MGSAGFISLNPKEPFKEPLKGTLIDPFKGTPGFISSAVPISSIRETNEPINLNLGARSTGALLV